MFLRETDVSYIISCIMGVSICVLASYAICTHFCAHFITCTTRLLQFCFYSSSVYGVSECVWAINRQIYSSHACNSQTHEPPASQACVVCSMLCGTGSLCGVQSKNLRTLRNTATRRTRATGNNTIWQLSEVAQFTRYVVRERAPLRVRQRPP